MINFRRSSTPSPRVLFPESTKRQHLWGICALVCLLYILAWQSLQLSPSQGLPTSYSSAPRSSSCAILLFGLPRAFPVVWPALQRHVILPNAAYGCDYYVHAFDVPSEPAGRSGQGGPIDTPNALKTLQQFIEEELPRDPVTWHLPKPATIYVSTSTNQEFETAHAKLLHKVETVKDQDGNLIYVPWKHENYEASTTTNILKMWHSIQKVWESMQDYQQFGRPYKRVAVLRLDVVHMTPVDVYQINATHRDVENTHVVLPGFAKYPVNDRGIYGPADAVQVWAAERFKKVDEYIQEFRFKRPGSGIHSERYLGQYLLPRMQNRFSRYKFVDRDDWCFYRARADYSIWISDCALPAHARRDAAVSYVTGCTCSEVQNRFRDVKEVTCCLNDTAVA